ncbi:MAG TPA: hydrogenase maturation protease [Leptolinea sp.]
MHLSWKEQINRHLQRLRDKSPDSTVVLVGVGNELMGDDAAGMLVIQNLKASLPANSYIHPVEGGPAPENCTGLIRRLIPGLVFFIDAGDMGEQPGSIGVFSCEESEGISAFGHALPLRVLGQYLKAELGCQSYLLIIQPDLIDFDIPVSKPVLQAIDLVCQGWLELSETKPGD